jgi:hypothetical protein
VECRIRVPLGELSLALQNLMYFVVSRDELAVTWTEEHLNIVLIHFSRELAEVCLSSLSSSMMLSLSVHVLRFLLIVVPLFWEDHSMAGRCLITFSQEPQVIFVVAVHTQFSQAPAARLALMELEQASIVAIDSVYL